MYTYTHTYTYTHARTHVHRLYLDGPITRRRDDVAMVKVHHIDSCSVAHQHSSQHNVVGRLHVPHGYGAVLQYLVEGDKEGRKEGREYGIRV